MKKKLTAFIICAVVAIGIGCGHNSQPDPENAPPTAKPPESSANQGLIEMYNKNLEKNPNDLNALTELGNLSMDTGQYNAAISYYQRVLNITPDNVNVHIDLGTCYRRIGQTQKTIEEYKKGLQYQPDHANALANLGIVLAYDTKDIDGAIAAWERYLQVAPAHPLAATIKQEIKKLRAKQHTQQHAAEAP